LRETDTAHIKIPMAIFTRRILQNLINENTKFLLRGQINKHVLELNRMDETLSLAYEWEIVLLNAFSKVGKVTYEKNFGGKKKADIFFEFPDDPNQNFVADITTVSDKGLEKKNPFEAFWDQIMQMAGKHGLRQNSFSLHVEDVHRRYYKGGPKIQLKLPGRARFQQTILDEQFEEFLNNISKTPTKSNAYRIKNKDFDVIIGYVPDQEFATGGHIDFTQVYSLTENTVYQALSNKATQLSGTKFKGPLGIFLCDGGCKFLRSRSTGGLSYTSGDVIKYFLHENALICFVVTFTIQQNRPSNIASGYHISAMVYKGLASEKFSLDILKLLEQIKSLFPQPESEAQNAIYHLKGKNPGKGLSHWGGLKMGHGDKITKVRISADSVKSFL